MWMLRVVNDAVPAQVFRLVPGSVRSIGRATGADFILDAPLVSRVHCRLTAHADGELEVRDLESTNGTYVNGSRIESDVVLRRGDRLRVGRVELEVEAAE